MTLTIGTILFFIALMYYDWLRLKILQFCFLIMFSATLAFNFYMFSSAGKGEGRMVVLTLGCEMLASTGMPILHMLYGCLTRKPIHCGH